MAAKNINELRVGVFVAIGLLLAMVFIFAIGGEHKLFQREYTLYANFKTISGLRLGAMVQLSGMKVGYVDQIHFPEDLERQEITVIMRVRKEFQDRIRADSVASVETQGLLGDKFIYISMGSGAQPVVPDKGILTSKETTSIFSLAEKAGEIMTNIASASKAIDDMLNNMKDSKKDSDLRGILKALRASLEQVQKGKGLMHALIYDPDGERIMKGINDALSDGGKGKGGMMSNLKTSSADLKRILDSISRGEGTLGKLINDPSLYDDLRALLGRANRNKLLRAVIRSTLYQNDKQMESDPK